MSKCRMHSRPSGMSEPGSSQVCSPSLAALLIALQCGLLLGLFSITSIPIDECQAHIWTHPEVPSVDLGRPIPEAWQSYFAVPEIERIEPYIEGFATGTSPPAAWNSAW